MQMFTRSSNAKTHPYSVHNKTSYMNVVPLAVFFRKTQLAEFTVFIVAPGMSESYENWNFDFARD